MQTYSHFLMTALAGDRLQKRQVKVHTKAFLLGSVLPDMALFALTGWFLVYYRWFVPAEQRPDSVFGDLYDQYYFHNPIWIVAHNLFHAPFILTTLGVIGYLGMRRGKGWGAALFWLAIGCGFHSLIDIFTHYNDGPLLFFPFDWRYRFTAPISYWDPQHGGRIFAPFELALDLLMIAYFVVIWLRRRRPQASTG